MLAFISNATSTAVKVSYAANPYALLVRLLAVHGDDLRMLSVVNGGPMAAAFIYALFSDDHIDGGWFKPSDLLTALFAHLARHTADDDEVDFLLSQARIVEAPKPDKADVARGQLLEQWRALEAARAVVVSARHPPRKAA
jgi:hypothetical protein